MSDDKRGDTRCAEKSALLAADFSGKCGGLSPALANIIFYDFLELAGDVFAADVAGEWTATAEGPNGAMQRTFTFKVDGSKLTGETVSSFLGKSEIKLDFDTMNAKVARYQRVEILKKV